MFHLYVCLYFFNKSYTMKNLLLLLLSLYKKSLPSPISLYTRTLSLQTHIHYDKNGTYLDLDMTLISFHLLSCIMGSAFVRTSSSTFCMYVQTAHILDMSDWMMKHLFDIITSISHTSPLLSLPPSVV